MNESQLKQRMEQYHTHLVNRAKWTKGWDVDYVTKKGQQTQIVFKCLHGKKYREEFFPGSLEKLQSTKGLADQCFQRAVQWCKGEHVDVVPNTWYASQLISPSLFNYGGIVNVPPGEYVLANDSLWTTFKLDSSAMQVAFKAVGDSLAAYAKALPMITWNPGPIEYPSYPSYTYTAGASVEWTTGYNTWGGPSILEQLTQVCPALLTVKRWCPECGEAYRNAGVEAEPLGNLIPHINDVHRWSREKIADWLDIVGTDPDVDLTIKPLKQEENNAQPSIGPGQQAEIEALGYGTVTLGGNAIQALSDV